MISTSEKSPALSHWENGGGITRLSNDGSELRRKLAANGITTVQHTVYGWSAYRYTSASKAIAEAERNSR